MPKSTAAAHHRRLSMQPYHSSGSGSKQSSSTTSSSTLSSQLTPSIRTLSSSTTTLTAQQPRSMQQQHALMPTTLHGSASHFPLFSPAAAAAAAAAHDPNTYSQTLTTSSSTRPIPTSAFQPLHPQQPHHHPHFHPQHASTEEINRSLGGGVGVCGIGPTSTTSSSTLVPMMSNNLSAKNRSYSVPRRLDNSQLNLSEINLDVSLLPIFHKILSERSRSLREGSSRERAVGSSQPGGSSSVGGSGGDLHTRSGGPGVSGGAGPSAPSTSSNLRRNKRANNLMLSCPNIMIKCDIVEYL